MFYQKFSLSEKYPKANLTAYVSDTNLKQPLRSAIIVCPGGGYGGLSPREAEPIVMRFLGEGFNVYLLKYTTGEGAKDYAPLIQASLAVKMVRERAEEDHTDPKKIFIMGFSAGGHLAASAGILWNIPVVRDAVGVTSGECEEGINRPDGMILCYPVITMGTKTHKGTALLVNGHNYEEPLDVLTPEEIERFSLEKHVDSTTPPAFIWHTFTDATVPVENAILLMSALASSKIPFESHIYPEGLHGLALCNTITNEGSERLIRPHVEGWAALAVKWIHDFF